MNKKPLVSVIIPNWNGQKWLRNCFYSIEEQTYKNVETILVDNASQDNSIGYTKNNYSNIKIIQNKENFGYALANNLAVKMVKGQILFFLNNDTKIKCNCIETLVNEIQKDENIGACAPKIMNYEGKTQLSLGVGCDIFGYPLLSGAEKLFYVDGAALFIRKDVFDEIGGFDERYFMFHEDIDLSWRLQLYGYKIKSVPEALVLHESGGTAVGGAIKEGEYTTTSWRRYLAERNNICNLLKNYNFLTLFFVLPFYILINISECSIFLYKRKNDVVKAYIDAWYWNFRNIENTLKRHRKTQIERKITDRQILKKMHMGSSKLLIFKKIGVPKFK